MSRTITIALPSEKRTVLVADLDALTSVVSLMVLPGASLKPPGDVVVVSTTNAGMQSVLGLLDRYEIGPEASVETSEPRSLVSSTNRRQLSDEGNEGSWPEMGALLRRNTNITAAQWLSPLRSSR